MAVKHVTIYECDACRAQVDSKGLIAVKVGPYAADVCEECLRKMNFSLKTSTWNSNEKKGRSGGFFGTNPLVASMRSIVAANLGDEVEVPAEPLEQPHRTS